jgi:hypothetical protein
MSDNMDTTCSRQRGEERRGWHVEKTINVTVIKVPQIKYLVDSRLSFDQAVAQCIEDRGEEDYLAKLYPDNSFNF